MNLLIRESFELDIELSLTSLEESNFKQFTNSLEMSFLKNEVFWKKKLTTWLNYIFKDPSSTCPKEIRNLNSEINTLII